MHRDTKKTREGCDAEPGAPGTWFSNAQRGRRPSWSYVALCGESGAGQGFFEGDGVGEGAPVGVVSQLAVAAWALPAGPAPKAARMFSVTRVTTRPGHGIAQLGSSLGIHSSVPLANTP